MSTMKIAIYGIGALFVLGLVWWIFKKILFLLIGAAIIGVAVRFVFPSVFRRK